MLRVADLCFSDATIRLLLRQDHQVADEERRRLEEQRKENDTQTCAAAQREARAAAHHLTRERAKHTSERYITALQQQLRGQAVRKHSNAQAPALCPCDRQRQEEGRAVLGPVWEQCATNCPFYNNPKA
jgi:hypothetical protein